MTKCIHPYAQQECPRCGLVFCFDCCGGTNVHEGGKHEPDYMLCPQCNYDVLAENNQTVKEEQNAS